MRHYLYGLGDETTYIESKVAPAPAPKPVVVQVPSAPSGSVLVKPSPGRAPVYMTPAQARFFNPNIGPESLTPETKITGRFADGPASAASQYKVRKQAIRARVAENAAAIAEWEGKMRALEPKIRKQYEIDLKASGEQAAATARGLVAVQKLTRVATPADFREYSDLRFRIEQARQQNRELGVEGTKIDQALARANEALRGTLDFALESD